MTPPISSTGNAIGRALVSTINSSLCIQKLFSSIFVYSLRCTYVNTTSVPRQRPSASPYHTTTQATGNTQDGETLLDSTPPATGRGGKELRFRRIPSLCRTSAKGAPIWSCRTTTQDTGNITQEGEIPHADKSPASGRRKGRELRIRRVPQLSRTKAKARRVTPSTNLIVALRLIGQLHALPRQPHKKLDLSFGPAWRRLPQQKVSAMISRKPSRKSCDPQPIRGEADPTLELSLPRILAIYLIDLHPLLDQDSTGYDNEHCSPTLDARISGIFSDQNVAYLAQRGFDATDVMTWAWILSARTTDQALSRLFAIVSCRFPERSAREAIPTFVFLFLLRREHMSAKNLKLCLIHAWDRLENRTTLDRRLGEAMKSKLCYQGKGGSLDADVQPPSKMDEKTVTVMIIRLLRHARQVWVPSVVDISRMISKHIYGSRTVSQAGALGEKAAARLTHFYNRVLSLLSLPPPLDPYLSIPYRQRAQFHLINRMTQFSPPLPINKEGYLAVARVQAAHRKTANERQWAELKSKSWPPWIEEKTGLDTEKGVEHGTSRAKEALTRMKEAGYTPGTWGKVVDIFAGWDTDGSPTIQTRAQFSKKPREEDIWAARIKSTRTANEAWACFLTWCDERLPPSRGVYFAMMEKLVYEKERERGRVVPEGRAKTERSGKPALPGDGKEVFPEPVSPKEAIHLRSQPPSVNFLYGRMRQDGINPTGRFLEFLVSHAESIKIGLDYLSTVWRNFGKKMAFTLAQPDLAEQPWNSTGNVLLRNMTDQTFTALIHLLCRFPRPWGGPVKKPLVHAFRLLLLRRPKYRPAWNTLLAAFAKEKPALADPKKTRGSSHDTLTWELMVQLVNQMKMLDLAIDGQGFLFLCVKLETTILALLKPGKPIPTLTGDEAECVPENALRFIKSTFQELVGSVVGLKLEQQVSLDPDIGLLGETDERLPLPSLLAIPHPSEIHAYVRVLGLLQEHEELLALFHWMAKHSSELDVVANESNNGRRIRRRAVVAARVFLEPSYWEKVSCKPGKGDAHILEQVKMVVESMESWGGWPSDDEVAAYIKVGRKTNRLPGK
ncbi:MAG: hypothetical protein M1839_007277 [Geoglossum umbratile]|nr:MAG: hypothetical protein M1839_007277 [Geoglossum umbratile]